MQSSAPLLSLVTATAVHLLFDSIRRNAFKIQASEQEEARADALAAKESAAVTASIESEVRRLREETAETLKTLEVICPSLSCCWISF